MGGGGGWEAFLRYSMHQHHEVNMSNAVNSPFEMNNRKEGRKEGRRGKRTRNVNQGDKESALIFHVR